MAVLVLLRIRAAVRDGRNVRMDADRPARARRLRRLLHGYFRARVDGIEQMPGGPFLAVGNHSGGVLIPDVLVWLSAYHATGRSPALHTLAHDAIFSTYPSALRDWMSDWGAVPAEPGAAHRLLEAGHAVQVYPGGDLDACRPFHARNRICFGGRTGYVRLAREAGVPIVPVVSQGAHRSIIILRSGRRLARWTGAHRRYRLAALPLSLSLPWGLWLGPVPGYIPLPLPIRIRVLPPIEPEGTIEQVDARVRDAMQTTLSDMVGR